MNLITEASQCVIPAVNQTILELIVWVKSVKPAYSDYDILHDEAEKAAPPSDPHLVFSLRKSLVLLL